MSVSILRVQYRRNLIPSVNALLKIFSFSFLHFYFLNSPCRTRTRVYFIQRLVLPRALFLDFIDLQKIQKQINVNGFVRNYQFEIDY